MLQKVISLCLLTYAISCGYKTRPPKDPIAQLSGKWSMVFGNSCKAYSLKSDTLVLHPIGTSMDQHCKFSAPNSIELDQRRDSSPPSETKTS
jgi:hypothetical protein